VRLAGRGLELSALRQPLCGAGGDAIARAGGHLVGAIRGRVVSILARKPQMKVVTGIQRDCKGHVYDCVSSDLSGASLGVTSDKNFVFSQNTPSTLWTVTHNLGKYPSVSVIDSAGTLCFGEVKYISLNQLTISFGWAFSGKVSLN
jgi:hypothetical protein